ncbi:hypothetical protein H7J07_17865 [Mycobacterium koreense]|uniref:Uncharacterized protein n=1 Tax=Mycolicibacillus koreensis TaxID=1069220 RepID=A0AA91PE14_9MYCO|nr:hypothetical protein [Mycolicibacillus koreensis]MCV7250066.1 hypothetical protein [Mycolicibacillus koreensis]OSC32927.1 hypothetical protein B8W67_13265 [Mycolicibacillus koreensis]
MNRRAIAIAFALTVVAAGCTWSPERSSQPPTTSEPPPAVDQLHPPFTSVWSAAPGIDLLSRPAELVRATQEGQYLTRVYGPDKTFPGYLNAIGGPKDPQYDPNYRFGTTSQAEPPWRDDADTPMTNYYHLADLSVSADATTISALVCSYHILTPDNNMSGWWNVAKLFATEIELSNPNPDSGLTSLIDDDPNMPNPGAQMPPSWNVFTTWHIARIWELFFYDDIPTDCFDWQTSQLPELQPRSQPWSSSEVAREPVKPQFPEWIPPNQI